MNDVSREFLLGWLGSLSVESCLTGASLATETCCGATESVSLPNLEGVWEREVARDEHLDDGLVLRD